MTQGGSAPSTYNHHWRWIDCLWIPLFSFLERIWRTQLESGMQFLAQSEESGFTAARGPHLWVWGKKTLLHRQRSYSWVVRDTEWSLPHTKAVWLALNRVYLYLHLLECMAFSQNGKKMIRFSKWSGFKLFLFALGKALTYSVHQTFPQNVPLKLEKISVTRHLKMNSESSGLVPVTVFV